MELSRNLTLKEAIKSNTAIRKGIDNIPTDEQIEKLKVTARMIFQPIRNHFNVPIGVTSMFRSKSLNMAIGGSLTSQHCKCEAIDIDADKYEGEVKDEDGNKVPLTNKMIFDYIKDNLEYDQLIWEFGNNNEPAWIHVSYKENNNRKRRLKAFKNSNGKTQYSIM